MAAAISVSLDQDADQLRVDPPKGTRSISLFNALGALVLRRQATAPRTIIDTSGLPSGAYIVRLDEQGQAVRWVKP